jgi:HEAT repeat protein
MMQRAEALEYPKKVEALLVVASQGSDGKTDKEAQEKILTMDPQKSIPVLVQLLNTPDIMNLIFFERFFSAHAFQALPYLAKQGTNPDPLIKARALSYLGQLRDTRELPSCIEAMKDSSWRVRTAAIRALGDMLAKERLKTLIPMLSAFKEADSKNSPGPIELFIKDKKMRSAVLSVLVRAVPLDYRFYRKWSDDASEFKEEQYPEFSQIIFEHRVELVPLAETWIRDIRQSDPYGRTLMQSLDDPDPDIKRSAAYALGQMKYQPALPRLIALLRDPYFMVRDTTALGLVFYGRKAIPDLEANMSSDSPALLILKLDILARINGEKARQLVEGYADHSNEGVRGMARRALEIIAAQKPPIGVDEENEE